MAFLEDGRVAGVGRQAGGTEVIAEEIVYRPGLAHGNSLAVEVIILGDGRAGFFVIVANLERGDAVLGFEQAVAVAIPEGAYYHRRS